LAANPEHVAELRRLWDLVKRGSLPELAGRERALQELALYQSWLGSIAESAIESGGKLADEHRKLLEIRQQEGNRSLWSAAGDLGESARLHLARLLAVEDLLGKLPVES
jgi:hypothetical protein